MGAPERTDATPSGAPSTERARDHLANERTYLAWLRTAIGILALSAAIARFGPGAGPHAGTHDKVAVAITGCLGLFILGIGTRRYYQVSHDLEQGRFQLSRRTPLVVGLVVVLSALTVLPLLL